MKVIQNAVRVEGKFLVSEDDKVLSITTSNFYPGMGFITGGTDDMKQVIPDIPHVIDYTLNSNCLVKDVVDKLLWGTYGKNGAAHSFDTMGLDGKPLPCIYMPIRDLSVEHLEAIKRTQPLRGELVTLVIDYWLAHHRFQFNLTELGIQDRESITTMKNVSIRIKDYIHSLNFPLVD